MSHFTLLFCCVILLGTTVSAQSNDTKCVFPGTCSPPPNALNGFRLPTASRMQWAWKGGFCGAVSIQTLALAQGVWISQDLIRKAAAPGGGHGHPATGYEILHTNIEGALTNLGLTYNAFDYLHTPLPQSQYYLPWLKQQLSLGYGVVWFIMCKGDGHNTYGIPNATYDHIEPVFGLYSNHSLTDPTVYADDVLVHSSDYAPDGDRNLGYFRRFDSLVDTTAMNGNCSLAQPIWMRNEMYPCLERNFSFGYAITGLVRAGGLRVSVDVGSVSEPNVRDHQLPVNFTSVSVTCYGVVQGQTYTVFRFDGGNVNVPVDVQEYNTYATNKWSVQGASSGVVVSKDPNPVLSSSAVAYRCV
eukprot:PhF_6_TR33626/c0_g1_i1/m.49112